MTERDDARMKLRDSINSLARQSNLYANMQKEPLKMLGGASAVGLVLGTLVGTRIRRTRKVYVDAGSSVKEQKAFAKAQLRASKGGKSVGNMLMGMLVTTGIKILQERVITPKLEEMTQKLNEQQRTGAPVEVQKTVVIHKEGADPRRM